MILPRRYFLFFGGFLLLPLFLSGCTDGEIPVIDIDKSVLYANECGFDGLSCCLNSEPECLYGQTCCSHPDSPGKKHCFDDCSCGAADRFCCAGGKCGEGLACFEGFCVECGGLNELCCGGVCEGESACLAGKCVECGLVGNPCCLQGDPCEPGDGKDYRIECSRGSCAECGSDGRLACASDPFCLENNLLNNGICYSCGGENEPCCSSGTGCREGLSCSLGFCSG